ncbi:sensor histidine kinase [Actinopolymorpha alba]|uniref:sensor histidine kinase n=1 Tax=Actinopolymorpha alba TaxID=533267 RepID=UPI000367F821|nr:ATP-binding protein [Actinopolymorpha alba]
MDATLAATLGGLVGLAIGGVAAFAFRYSERDLARGPELPEPAVPPDVAKVLAVLRSAAVVVGPHDDVRQASAPAWSLGIVRGSRIVVSEVLDLVRQVRRDGEIRQCDLEIQRGRFGHDVVSVSARVAPVGSQLILVLVEDRTKERRIDAIRRDFVANVSHELKTPIGALILLAEAVQHAADDPEAVQRFAGRMQIESDRLTRLVQQIIELSRVQADDPVEEASPVSLDAVVDAALDRCRVDAQSKSIPLVRAGERDLVVHGSEQQLVIAVGNLVENAVSYSPEHTRVVVDVRRSDPVGDDADGATSFVELAVSDQGVGIPERELERVFERFYRVDQARSRETGGTGLGLSIVKHVAASHGGAVAVWSVEGEGSTFTIRLPLRGESVLDSLPRPGQEYAQPAGPEPAPQDGAAGHSASGQKRPSVLASSSVVRRQKEATR